MKTACNDEHDCARLDDEGVECDFFKKCVCYDGCSHCKSYEDDEFNTCADRSAWPENQPDAQGGEVE